MLSQTEVERELYEARRKGHLDYLTDMRVERQIGRRDGRVEGRIQLLQKLLRLPMSSDEELEAMGSVELDSLANTLVVNARTNGLDI